MSRAVCIIQARRQSTRLPDKILLPLGGKPVLRHVIERCQRIPGIDEVIVAAAVGEIEDPVEALARAAGVRTYRGPMDDVLARYWGAATMTDCDHVMRVTADCPLIDPEVCGRLVGEVRETGADFGMLRHWPHGLDCEFFTFALLEAANTYADKAVDREHVTLWMKAQDNVRKLWVEPEEGDLHRGNRWVVDYPEDYQFLEALFALLPAGQEMPSYRDVLTLLDAHPHLREINRMREQDWAEATEKLYEASGQAWEKPV